MDTEGGGGILQVHPTRLCNLACAHCYSSSSPTVRTGLDPQIVSQAIEDAAALGFNIVSLSGGEPLLYQGLDSVLQAAKNASCRVNLVSNGILIGGPRYERFADAFGLVALSLDGLPARHNTIRGSPTSFGRVRAAAATLRRDGKAFGIIHTLTSESLEEVEELAAIAAEWGAVLLQLHPFEASGRGNGLSFMTPLSDQERVIVYILAAALAINLPQLKIQLDLVHRSIVRQRPEMLHGAPLQQSSTPRELVIQDDGTVVPLTYGLPSAWAVVDLKAERLASAWPRYLQTRWPELRRRTRAAAIAIVRGRYGEVAEWHSVVRQYARVGGGGGAGEIAELMTTEWK